MRQHHECDVVAQFAVEGGAIDGFHSDGSTSTLGHRFHDVEIRMKVRNVGQDHVSITTLVKRSADELREHEGESVRDQYFAALSADERREAITESRWHRHPSSGVPTSHEAFCPLTAQYLVDARRYRA